MTRSIGRASLIACLLASSSMGDEPRGVISIRARNPDRQVRELIGLFRGSRAEHPAAALAAWKRASREPGRLGKPLEALIACFNPAMADELRTLDGAELAYWFDPVPDGRLAWGASIPRDDGTFAALASAFVLSGGRAEGPVDGQPADRLAGPGSPWMARGPRGVLIARDPDALRTTRIRAERPDDPGGEPDGFRLEMGRGALEGSDSLTVRRIGEALRATTGPISARLEVRDRAIRAVGDLTIPNQTGRAVLDPAWLDWIPSGRAVAGFALAISPGPATWVEVFGLVDRVEKVDPARANLAPGRLRLAILARSLGIRAEAELFPNLRGLTAWVGSDGSGMDSGLVALHLADEAIASRIAGRIKREGPGSDVVGRFGGRAHYLSQIRQTLAIGWGEGSIAASEAARGDPGLSAGPGLRAGWGGQPPAMAGGVWPSRVPGLFPNSSPLHSAFEPAPPMIFRGSLVGADGFQVEARWDDLDASIRRFLELIPLDPPPDR